MIVICVRQNVEQKCVQIVRESHSVRDLFNRCQDIYPRTEAALYRISKLHFTWRIVRFRACPCSSLFRKISHFRTSMVGIGVLDISVLALLITYSDLQTETQCLRRTILFASPLKPMDTITRQPWITLTPCCCQSQHWPCHHRASRHRCCTTRCYGGTASLHISH
jgi:hypothetical protein